METAALLIGAVSGFIVAITGLLAVLAKLWRRDNYTDNRVKLLWRANIRRGLEEGISRAMITEHAPAVMALSTEARAAYEPIAPFLRQMRRQYPALDEGDLAEKIEERFGDWLARHICRPLGVSNYACLQMAFVVAMESPAEET